MSSADLRAPHVTGPLVLVGLCVAIVLPIALTYFSQPIALIALSVFALLGFVAQSAAHAQAAEKARQLKGDLHRAYVAKQHIMDYSFDVICTLDRQGRFAEVSAASEMLWGYRAGELIGRPHTEHVHPEDRHRTQETIRALGQRPASHTFQNRFILKNGRIVDLIVSLDSRR